MNISFKDCHLYLIGVWLTVVLSCAFISPAPAQKTLLPWPHQDKPPALVILPFENTTDEKGLNIIFRQYLANHLSEKNYRNLKLNEVDEALAVFERSLDEKWQDVSPVTLGRLFRCNYLLYGEVTRFKTLFWGVYAQAAIGIHLKLVETIHGNIVWQKTLVKRAHDGGFPFSLFNIMPDFLHCSRHVSKETKMSLVEKACRELAAELPEPPTPSAAVFIIDIQVASFTEKNRAIKIIKELKAKGFAARIEKVMLANGAWYRVVLGPFYDQQEAAISKRRLESDPRLKPIFIHY
jgi:hypothetical protein